MKQKTTLPIEMQIACCKTCLLSQAMKDCKNCPFKVGLTTKDDTVSTKEQVNHD